MNKCDAISYLKWLLTLVIETPTEADKRRMKRLQFQMEKETKRRW